MQANDFGTLTHVKMAFHGIPNHPVKLVKIVGRGAEAKTAAELSLKTTVGRAGVGTCLGLSCVSDP